MPRRLQPPWRGITLKQSSPRKRFNPAVSKCHGKIEAIKWRIGALPSVDIVKYDVTIIRAGDDAVNAENGTFIAHSDMKTSKGSEHS
jgi:hypothetical protein